LRLLLHAQQSQDVEGYKMPTFQTSQHEYSNILTVTLLLLTSLTVPITLTFAFLKMTLLYH